MESKNYLQEILTAFQAARERARSTVVVEETLQQLAIAEAKRTGLTIRQTAKLLDLTKTGVSRQWNVNPKNELEMPQHGSMAEAQQAASCAWSQNPELEHQLMPKLTENNLCNSDQKEHDET